MNMVKEDVRVSLGSVLESCYQKRDVIKTQLLPLAFSPHRREKESEHFTELLEQQKALALSLGSHFLEFFEDSESFNQMLQNLIQELKSDFTVEGIKRLDSNDLSNERLSDELSDELSVENEALEFDQTIKTQEAERRQEAELTLMGTSSLERLQPTVKPMEPVLLAEHTGRSIDLPEDSTPSVDLSLLFERGFGGSFSEELPEPKEKKSVKSLDERLLERLSSMPAPSKIEHEMAFNDAFSWIQRIADPTYIKRWPNQGKELARVLCKFTVNYTRYLFDIPDYLRAHGMKGDNSFIKVIERIKSFIKKHKYEQINGLKDSDIPKNQQWLNDAVNSYYHLQELLKERSSRSERLNGDRQIEKLKKMVFNDETVDSICKQVMVILQQTDVNAQDQRLSKLLIDYIDDLKGSEFKSLRSSIRSYIEQVEAEESEPQTKEVQFPQFANKKLTVIGGDRRHEATLYLKSILPETIDFTWLDVASSNGSNARHSLKKSIENGGLDALIIIQRFISHGVTEPIKAIIKEHPQCKSAMAKGYGKAQLKLALEFIADQW